MSWSMWVLIFCGWVICKVFCSILYDDDVMDVETTVSNPIFTVANRLGKLYGGKAYTGLRIPDPDSSSRENVDIVLVTKGAAVVISVKNFSGFVSVNGDGSWVCEAKDSHKAEVHPDPVKQVKKQASIIESYLEQRGLTLPEGYLSYKVIIPNPKFRAIYSNIPPEVVTYDKWMQPKSEHNITVTGLIKGAFHGGKKDVQESINQQLNFILNTAPIWDRLELKGNKYVLGEFIEFKGEQEDTHALRDIKRSKVGHLTIQKMTLLGFELARTRVSYSFRDYRSEPASTSQQNEVAVGSSTEVRFKPENSTKVCKCKLSSILSMSLSA